MMQLSQAATVTHGKLYGDDCQFERVTIDSRRVCGGDLFVAIPGERYNGHDFIIHANQKGARGALVSSPSRCRIAQIKVADTTTALGRLGAHWRRRFDYPLLAVTGSNGKTTVTSLLASILNQTGNCLAPHGSFNNQWGVPLTLLRMQESHTHAVVEIGMNRPGEIKTLSGLVKPSLALINNVGTAHLAGLGTLQRIAQAKAEIFSGLPRDGTAVLNADDPFYPYWLRCLNVDNLVRFSVNPETKQTAEVRADKISVGACGSEFELNLKGQRIPIQLPLLGPHNVKNAVAAAAAAYAVGVDVSAIQSALKSSVAVNGRLHSVRGINGALIVDDSYNANPDSSKAALDVLAGFSGTRIAVLGSMAELGAQSNDLHYQVGMHGRKCGIERLLCLGAAEHRGIAHYARGFGATAQCYQDIEQLLEELIPTLTSETTVLVKGSRSTAMERVVSGLTVPVGGSQC